MYKRQVVCSACHAKIHEAEGGFTKAQRNEEVVSEKKYADMTAKLAYMYGNGLGIELSLIHILSWVVALGLLSETTAV